MQGLFDNTPAQQLVNKATDELLLSLDWAMAIDLSELVLSQPTAAKDALKGIKKRLTHKEPKVHAYAITLLDFLVKNCGPPFLTAVESKEFLPAILQMAAAPRTDEEVRRQIVGIVNTGANAGGADFAHGRSQLLGLGVQFPSADGGYQLNYASSGGSQPPPPMHGVSPMGGGMAALMPVADDPIPTCSSTRGPVTAPPRRPHAPPPPPSAAEEDDARRAEEAAEAEAAALEEEHLQMALAASLGTVSLDGAPPTVQPARISA